MVMDCASAELCKYAANAMLATRISFMNEIANVCERFGADADKVRQAIASDRRIGPAFLFPGVGYGGSCFPKDVKAIVKFSADKKYRFRILEAVEAVNETQKLRLLDKIDRQLRQNPEGQDDRRLGTGVQAAHRRHARGAGDSDHRGRAEARGEGAGVRSRGARRGPRAIFRSAHPLCEERLRRAQGRRRAARSSPSGTSSASRTSSQMKRLMKQPVIFDGRNIYDPQQIRALGFTLLRRSAGHERRASSQAAPATSAATPSRRWRPPATTSSSTTTCRPATPRRSSGSRRGAPDGRSRWSRATSSTRPGAGRCASLRRDGRHAFCGTACWWGSRSVSRSATTAPTSAAR